MNDRVIPAAVQAELEASASADAILAFLTITHRNLSEPIRVVSDVFDYELGGLSFIGLPFDLKVVTDADSAPYTELRMQNIDRRIGQALLGLTERAQLALQVLSSADFDLSVDPRVEIGTAATIYAFADFELVDVDAGATELTGRVMLRDPTQEPWPSVRATQGRCPGLFR